jgi:hypothetical protein
VSDDDTPPPDRPWDQKPPRRKRPARDDEEEDDYDERPRRRRRPSRDDEPDPALKMIVPLNTSILAIIAGYVGLISVLCIPAPLALLLGVLALVHLKKHPKLDGKVRAIFAIVMGAIFSVVLLLCIVASIVR